MNEHSPKILTGEEKATVRCWINLGWLVLRKVMGDGFAWVGSQFEAIALGFYHVLRLHVHCHLSCLYYLKKNNILF